MLTVICLILISVNIGLIAYCLNLIFDIYRIMRILKHKKTGKKYIVNDWKEWNKKDNELGFPIGTMCRLWIMYDTVSPMCECQNVFEYLMHYGVENIIGKKLVYTTGEDWSTDLFFNWDSINDKFDRCGCATQFKILKDKWYPKIR